MAKTTKPKQRSSLKPAKKKLHTRTQCLTLAQKLCKLRFLKEHGRLWCISCGQPLELGTTNCQGGHFEGRANKATETEPDNLWPQCAICNVRLYGNHVPFRFNLVRLIGEERVNRIECMAMAYKGNREAFESLSAEDQQKVRMKKSAKYYDALYYELRDEIKQLEKEIEA